jgi:hypothetical protein
LNVGTLNVQFFSSYLLAFLPSTWLFDPLVLPLAALVSLSPGRPSGYPWPLLLDPGLPLVAPRCGLWFTLVTPSGLRYWSPLWLLLWLPLAPYGLPCGLSLWSSFLDHHYFLSFSFSLSLLALFFLHHLYSINVTLPYSSTSTCIPLVMTIQLIDVSLINNMASVYHVKAFIW